MFRNSPILKQASGGATRLIPNYMYFINTLILTDLGTMIMRSAVSDMTEEFSDLAVVASAVVSVLTFPLGLAVPGYLYLKATPTERRDMSTVEVCPAILHWLPGESLVQIVCRTIAKLYWLAVVLLGLLGLLAFAAFLPGAVGLPVLT